ncbi:MAG TPA: response regulator transcription factor [Anaerolineae bacterium]|nr:response regulator transcription factor [Anaerolineae bacterium]
MPSIRVMVVDDHPIVRQGVRSLLSNYADFEIAGEADSGSGALESAARLAPDVILLDIRMPGETGIEIVKKLRQAAPEAKVLMLTSFDDDEYVTGALRAGAHGYVLKNVSDEILASAIRAVYHGERVLSSQVMDRVIQHYVDEAYEASAVGLTEEERRILRLLAEGDSNAQIAADLYLSETTVKRKLQDIFDKLSVRSRAQAAAEAVRRKLI